MPAGVPAGTRPTGGPAGTGSAGDGLPPDRPSGVGDPVPRTPEERAAQRAARELRSINIALYSASLLLVAAGGLFIGAAVPGTARAATISVVVALFYVSGLVLHTRLPHLRPAAVAFTGTGLALLPVAGLFFGFLTGQVALAWFATAVVGTVAYVLAAVRLHSRVVAFLTLPFFLSIALSSVSLLGGALVWYFTCSIGVAAILAGLLRLAPGWLPEVISRAVVDTHRLLAPSALVASVLLGPVLTEADRAPLWVVATLYYAALLAFYDAQRVQHFYAVRLVGTIAVVLAAGAAGSPAGWISFLLAVCLALQITALLAVPGRARAFLDAARSAGRDNPDVVTRRASLYAVDVVLTFVMLGLAAAAAIFSSGWGLLAGPGNGPDPLLPVLLVLITGMAIAVRSGGLLESLVLPGVLLSTMTRWDDPWRTETVLALTAVYLVLRAGRSTGRYRERFMLAARGAVTLLAPTAVLVHVQPPLLPPWRVGEVAGLALLVAFAVNQLVEVRRWRRRSASVYSPWVICTASGASLATAVALASGTEAFAVVASGLWLCVLAGCLTSLLLPLGKAGGRGLSAAAPHDAEGIEASDRGLSAAALHDPTDDAAGGRGPSAAAPQDPTDDAAVVGSCPLL